MDTFALVLHDEQTFLAKVVNYGSEHGIFTSDRADELIRVSVAMATKYVLHKEVDFRSSEELAKVQETILRLVGVGIEIRSKGDLEEGIRLLMEVSPVELFRLAHTRIEKLRHRWRLLLQDHRIEILVSAEEYSCLGELSHQRLSEMSIFTESEIHTIQSLTLEDRLFSTLGLLEYYERELERYEFTLRLRRLLPFDLLNRSCSVHAENLAEVDAIRHALINTLIVSGMLDLDDPVAVSTPDVRKFLASLDLQEAAEGFPPDMENAIIDIVQELSEDLADQDRSMLTEEIVRCGQHLLETIVREWDTVTTRDETSFFKRWCRIVILSEAPNLLARILVGDGMLDELDFEILSDQIVALPEGDAIRLIEQMPWNRLTPGQIMRLLHHAQSYQVDLAAHLSLTGFTAQDVVELLETVGPEGFHAMLPSLTAFLAETVFSLDELELFATLPSPEATTVLFMANPPADIDVNRIAGEFRDATDKVKEILFFSCSRADFFPEVFHEAWAYDPAFVKRQAKTIPAADIGPFLLRAAGGKRPEVVRAPKTAMGLAFPAPELNAFFKALPAEKRKAATRYFSKES
jgi:hypothetical protein